MHRENWILNKLKISIIIFTLVACNQPKKSLPVYGRKQMNDKGIDVDHTISKFSFINQSNRLVTQKDFEGKVYITDFFFTTCKTICPKMTTQLSRIQQELKGEDYKILSHTVNPSYDSSSVLLDYSKEMKADLSNWDFVTGNAQEIYKQAASYQVVAIEDTSQPIPFVHSEYLVLIDKQSRVRGMYDGTDKIEVDKLINDTKWLIKQ
ncbi:MAG: SCO family protein [Flavobacteriales bacterium]|nr:SCO family protein [Flavobacteriales bacterium]